MKLEYGFFTLLRSQKCEHKPLRSEHMIILQVSASADEMSKPVICPKCNRGRIGNIPLWSKAEISRRGKPPSDKRNDGVQVKCPKCGVLWTFTIE